MSCPAAPPRFNASRASPCIFTSDTPVARGQACVDLSRWLDTAPAALSWNTPLNKIVDVCHALRLRHVRVAPLHICQLNSASYFCFVADLKSDTHHTHGSPGGHHHQEAHIAGASTVCCQNALNVTHPILLQRINGSNSRPKPFSK